MTTNISNIDELIKAQNPFAGHLVVKPQQIWGKSFPDVFRKDFLNLQEQS